MPLTANVPSDARFANRRTRNPWAIGHDQAEVGKRAQHDGVTIFLLLLITQAANPGDGPMHAAVGFTCCRAALACSDLISKAKVDSNAASEQMTMNDVSSNMPMEGMDKGHSETFPDRANRVGRVYSRTSSIRAATTMPSNRAVPESPAAK